jgi:heme/copper-type cytochrome/quinol oxidase subunit 2
MGRAAAIAPLLLLAGCLTTSGTVQYPNSTFQPTTEFNRAIDALWDHLLIAGTVVFVLVEAMMIYIIVKYRARPGSASRATCTATPRSRSSGPRSRR